MTKKRLTPNMRHLLARLAAMPGARLVLWFEPTHSARLLLGRGENVPLATANGLVESGKLEEVERDVRRAIYVAKGEGR